MIRSSLFLSGAFLAAIFTVRALLPLTDVETVITRTQCRPKGKIVFMKTDPTNPVANSEIYMMNPDGSAATRLTNDTFGDAMPSLSRDGKGTIIFDSNRVADPNKKTGMTFDSDLFLMTVDVTNGKTTPPVHLTRGSSVSWSSDSKRIAFHRSRSGGYGMRIPGRTEPGGPTTDSDIFIAELDDLLAKRLVLSNITEKFEGLTPGGASSEDDADWSPDGKKIAFTSRASSCASNQACQASAEIWIMDADGSNRKQLTSNDEEERSPDWSPDGKKILYMCKPFAGKPFELCVMNVDGTGREVLASNTVPDLSPTWSPDGKRITFLRGGAGEQQIYALDYVTGPSGNRNEIALTRAPGINFFPNWGLVGCK
jgi:TolB protein